MDLKKEFRNSLINAIKSADIAFSEENICVEVPRDKNNGDLASNIAMKISNNRNPIEIANIIKAELEKNKIFDNVEVANPGFINIKFNKEYIYSNIFNVINEGSNYGRNNIGKNKKINIEYVSANPTGLLHLGTLRGGVYGDNLANIMRFCGYDVTREYYINDAGNQIENLGKSVFVRYQELCGIKNNMPEDGYYGKEIIDIAAKIYKEYGDTKLNKENKYYEELGVTTFLEKIKEDLLKIGIDFDVWTSEKEIREKGKIEKCLEEFKQRNLLYEQDGAIFLKTTKYGDDKDRVLIKSDKSYTYIVPDIAYHLDKIDRGYDELIDVLGTDHHGYVNRLKASVEALGYDKNKLTVKLLQLVRLIKDNKEIKMSKRTGETIKVSELYEEIGKDAIRYFYSSRSLDSQMELNLDLITKKSNENPLFYVQYAHARISSIFKEAEKQDIKCANKIENYDDNLYNLILKVYEFEDVVKTSCINKEPHLITNYVYDLATLFHYYYSKEKILTDDIIASSEKLCILKAVQITIKNALNLINVSAPEQM